MYYKYNKKNLNTSNVIIRNLFQKDFINKKGAIVFGGHVQGYGIIKIFGESKIPTILIDRSNKNIAKHSKYCWLFIECEDDDVISLLSSLNKYSELKGWLLFPTDDYYVRILSQNREELSNFFNVTVDDWGVIKHFFNKRFSYPLASENNIPIPETHYPNSIEDIEIISEKIEYPCIIKPAIMLDFYKYFGQKVFVCKNKMELLKNYTKALKILQPEELLIQEIIPGNCENQYSVGMFFDRDKSYNLISGRRKRQHPIDFGNATTFAETVNIPILIEYAEKILKAVNFSGICEVEFKYDSRTKEFKFFEVNPRTWKWHMISEVADIPFLLSIYHFMLYHKPIIKKEFNIVGWRDLVTDVPIILKLFFTGNLIRSRNKQVISAVFNKKDCKPFIYQLIYIFYFLVKR